MRERGLVSHRLLDPEAPLLVVRSVEGPDLVIVGRGPELGSQLIFQALIGCPIVESRHDGRGGSRPERTDCAGEVVSPHGVSLIRTLTNPGRLVMNESPTTAGKASSKIPKPPRKTVFGPNGDQAKPNRGAQSMASVAL